MMVAKAKLSVTKSARIWDIPGTGLHCAQGDSRGGRMQ
jgi:hypothetical protein